MFVVELLKKEKILGKTGQVASLERDLTLLAEEPWTLITLSSIYGNKLQYNIFEYTFFFFFRMNRGQFGGAAEAFGGGKYYQLYLLVTLHITCLKTTSLQMFCR